MKRIAEETPIIPEIVADKVVREYIDRYADRSRVLKAYTGEQMQDLLEKASAYLCTRAEHLFQNNKRFHDSIADKIGNRGRDSLYMFFDHWMPKAMSMYIKTNEIKFEINTIHLAVKLNLMKAVSLLTSIIFTLATLAHLIMVAKYADCITDSTLFVISWIGVWSIALASYGWYFKIIHNERLKDSLSR